MRKIRSLRPIQKTEADPAADGGRSGASERIEQIQQGVEKEDRDSLAAAFGRIDQLEKRVRIVERRLKIQRNRLQRFRGPFLDEAFHPLAQTVLEQGRTLLGLDRLYVLWQCARNVGAQRLPSVEIGAYRGGSAYFIACAFKALLGAELPVHVIDTFEGHPAAKVTSVDSSHKPGLFSDVSIEDVVTYLSGFSLTKVYKGEFTEVAERLPAGPYGLVHIDVDLYRTTLECLRFFAERLGAGGMIVVDDYGAAKCPGVEKAVSEFLLTHHSFHVWHMPTEQLVIVGAK